MKSKAWSLVGGLIALGTTRFADTLTRPAYAQNLPPTEPPSWISSDEHFLGDDDFREESDQVVAPKVLEFDLQIKPANNVSRLLSLYDDS